MNIKSLIIGRGQGGKYNILGWPLINYVIDVMSMVGTMENKQIDKDTLQASYNNTDLINFIEEADNIIMLSDDAPLITSATINMALENHKESGREATVLSVNKDEMECYREIYIFKADILKSILTKDNQEVSSPRDIVKELIKCAYTVESVYMANTSELIKVDSRRQLAKCTGIMKERINDRHMDNDVTLEDPNNIYIGPEVIIGRNTIIEPNVFLKGKTIIGEDCFIGNGTNIENSEISKGVLIENTHIHDSFVDEGAHLGPFAYVRPGSKIGKNVRIGDFVEIKNSNIGDNTKISHLTYVGDADVGEHVNFGCGSVLVNYDSVDKHRSVIEDYAFIGCNTNLVSPVTIGKRAYTAAGSTITNDIPEEALGISRVRQTNKEGWVAYKYPKK